MNNTEVSPIFFHRSSVTSAYNSAESIATLPPESDSDDEQTRDMLDSPLHLQEREAPTTSLSLLQRELCVKLITFPSRRGESCSCVLTHESRVKNLAPIETVFPWHIEQFKEKMKYYPDSLTR